MRGSEESKQERYKKKREKDIRRVISEAGTLGEKIKTRKGHR